MKPEGGQNWTPITPPRGSILHAETQVVSAAKSHVAFGLTLREAKQAEQYLTGSSKRHNGDDWER